MRRCRWLAIVASCLATFMPLSAAADGRAAPARGTFHDVVAIGAIDVWAVGAHGLVAHWDGASWDTDALGGLRVPDLTAVDAASGTDVWTVGGVLAYERLRPWLAHWDGSSWTRSPAPPVRDEVGLEDVAVASSDDVWAVGSTYRPTLRGGRTGSIVLHWNGARWSRVASPAGVALSAVSVAAGRVLIAGSRPGSGFPSVFRRVRDRWRETQMAYPSGWRCALADITAAPAAAVGTCARPGRVPRPYIVQRFSERIWGIGTTAARGSLLAVGGGGVSWAVGRERPAGTPLILRRRPDDAWTRVAVPPVGDGALEGVSGRSFGDAWAVGWRRAGGGRIPLAVRWDGSGWSVLPSP